MAKTFEQFQAQLALVLQDAAAKLAADARDACLVQAILQRYSKDRPVEKVVDLAGNATSDLPLPASFEQGFSFFTEVEYPVGSVPPTVLDDVNWTLYRTPTALVLRLLTAKPTAIETVRVSFPARHAADGSTVPEPDFEAVCDYAAALGYEKLAGFYTQTGDPSLQADSVNYRSKGEEYLALARSARRRYFAHLGIDEEATGQAVAGAGISIGELDEDLIGGIDRLTHPRSTR